MRKGSVGARKGIMTQDTIHRLDTMSNEIEENSESYSAKKKTTLNNDVLFDDNMYSDDEESESNEDLGRVIKISAFIVGIVVLILVALMIFL